MVKTTHNHHFNYKNYHHTRTSKITTWKDYFHWIRDKDKITRETQQVTTYQNYTTNCKPNTNFKEYSHPKLELLSTSYQTLPEEIKQKTEVLPTLRRKHHDEAQVPAKYEEAAIAHETAYTP